MSSSVISNRALASMLTAVEPRSRDAQVLDALAQLVAEAGLKPGDRLPPERMLTERLHVGRSTVREALTRWEALGVVERRQGSGTYLAAPIESGSVNVPVALKVEADSLLRTIEVRKTLEVEAVGLAAERRSDAQMAAIMKAWDVLENAHTKYGPSHDEDVEFHATILRASGNPLFGQIISQLHEAIRVVYTRSPLGQKEVGDDSFPLHYDLVMALEVKDVQAARTVIRDIIEITEREVKALVS